jgi:hypothetical protein
MHTLTLLFLLTVGLHCQNPSSYTITISCSNCDSSSSGCFKINGGPFNNTILTSQKTCTQYNSELQSQLGPDYSSPITHTFSCGLVCSGCGISVAYTNSSSTSASMITDSICVDTDAGSVVIESFNRLY